MATEPWLRGPIEGVHPVAAHLLYTFQQAREELERFTAGLDEAQLWTPPGAGCMSLGAQLRHIAGSTDRLATYLRGEQLSGAQLRALREEEQSGAGLAELLAELDAVFTRVEAQVRAIAPEEYLSPRAVGRKAMPTTVAGLIVHISEHAQRHLGQAVMTAKLMRQA